MVNGCNEEQELKGWEGVVYDSLWVGAHIECDGLTAETLLP